MVTFALPGDNDVADHPPRQTPRSRPPLPFAKRANASSVYASPSSRLGTPQSLSTRKLFSPRDEVPSSSLNKSSIATARNIFRASAISDSPPSTTPFSPSIPQNTPRKVFAPGATPEPSRVYRESTAQVAPRGVAAKATDKELFEMRISDPDPELTGEALTSKVPKDWNPRASIYADQFLAHLCPPDLDDEQRRQFFCILDLRRLKYSANEIFCRKDWKINIANFSKEFEKSRSIILLRYGLYEFRNVKPSQEIVKRWRREHGLADPEEDEAQRSTPTKPGLSKKRKAAADASDAADSQSSSGKAKRRATEPEPSPSPFAVPAPAPPAPTPAAPQVAGNKKRKASVSDETEGQPAKVPKAPSSARSLFEKAVNKAATPATPTFAFGSAPSPAPGSTPANKTAPNSLIRSVFNKESEAGQNGSGSNIFGYLSDASSTKNSGVDADGETESESDDEQSSGPGQSDVPAGKPATGENGTSSAAGTRESTPGRSLFDRVTKDSDGQPVRAEPAPEPAKDQTWNPSTTPIKFAPQPSSSGQAGAMFGGNSTAPTSSLFPGKSSAPPVSFGASKQEEPAKNATDDESAAADSTKDAGESDKENDSQSADKPAPAPEPKAPAVQSGFSMFQPKSTPAEATKDAEAPKTASNIFGSVPGSSATNAFGSSKSVMQSSTLFGSKPSEPAKSDSAEASKPAGLFGGADKTPSGVSTPSASFFAPQPSSLASEPPKKTSGESKPTASLFAPPSNSSATNVFGGSTTQPAPKALFGSSTPASTASTPAPAAPVASPFSFGAASGGDGKANGITQSAPKSMFGAPKSPEASSNAASAFDGSPMKQDAQSPLKPGPATSAPTGSLFSFGKSSTTPSNIFGGASTTPATNTTNGTGAFGAGTGAPNTGAPSFGFNFTGGASSGTTLNNPFAQAGNTGGAETASNTSTTPFAFGGGSNQPSGTSSPFQFGSTNGASGTPSGGLFGASKPDTNGTPTFGAGSTTSAAPFSFGANTSQSQLNSGGPVFGNNQSNPVINFQPLSGGASTGTNTPFTLGGGSSLATTPAGGTPEPSSQAEGSKGATNEEEGEKHEQINLSEAAEEGEDVLHDVRAKALKFIPPGEQPEDDKPKSKTPWSTQGVGPLRLLQNQETKAVRLLLRAEPRGHVAMNRALLPDVEYKADKKYVKLTTANEKGDGLETWMVQVKSNDLAKALAEALEKHKESNKK